ncbi:hypothetical protein DPMN_040488 [Dreissena polymorpha]|uniref:Dynamin N-terminal domain-containing protein n=1 Tax=Dreissena polymorpha TaxID=45954 RepID=A0A9D4HV89_DREPO|nr:hypothetical protein DPMN_040488 [Dreissena polymorpha]
MMQRTISRIYNPVNSSDEAADNSNTAVVPTMNEQTNMSTTKVTESYIDSIDDIRTAITTCKLHKIDYSDAALTNVQSLRRLIKRSLLCDGTTRAHIEDSLNKGQQNERPKMDHLIVLYKEAYALIKENDTFFSGIFKWNQNIMTDLTNGIENLKNYRSPILVLGETGAGKTSFINLLLGERLLPTSMLSNTHTICELSYSASGNLDADVEYVDPPSEEGVKTFSTKDNSKEFVEFMKVEAVKTNVRKITVHAPFNILKNNVVIVDSPGVGETQEMTDIVLGYVEKAAAFIYVIDMMNAGGVQQRVREFIEQVKKRAKGINGVKVQNAMFVCNKLDEVPTKEMDIVIKDTVERLRELWHELKSSQIIPFSTTEAQSFQEEGEVAPRFKTVLARLARLIPAAQFMTTHKAQTWLIDVLDKSLHIASGHIENSILSEKQLFDKKTMAQQRIKDLEKEMNAFISEQRGNIAKRIQEGAAEMYDRVNTEQTKGQVCRFETEALPTDSKWHDAAANIRTQLFEKIIKAMNLPRFAENLEGKIKTELAAKIPSFQSILNALQVTVSGRNDTVIEEKTTEFLPEYVRKVYGKSIGMTALLTPAMPFIALGRLPVFFVKRFQESREMSAMENMYKTANGRKVQIKEVCEKYAKYVFQHVVKQMEIQTLATESMQVCYSRLDELENEMKEKISSDRKFIEGFPEKHRDIQLGLKKINEIDDKLKCLKSEVDKCLKEDE